MLDSAGMTEASVSGAMDTDLPIRRQYKHPWKKQSTPESSSPNMKTPSLHLIFRIGCAMCYTGHGLFGFITKKIWCNYFAVFGIGEQTAYELMPWVGAMDVLLGILLVVYPIRFAALWLVFWGLFTATLRPLSGEPFAESIERAGNFGAPLILLLLSQPPSGIFNVLQKLSPRRESDPDLTGLLRICLQFFGFMLLAGHGILNLINKPGLLNQYSQIGIAQPETVALFIGIFECVGAVLVVMKPTRITVMILLIWKVISETIYPSHPIIEWVERGGSYVTLLGLWIVLTAPYNTVPLMKNLLFPRVAKPSKP